jgi:hypothetical protein
MNRRPPRTNGDTRLDRFLTSKEIDPKTFAKELGCSRQWLQRLRFGDAEPTAKFIPDVVRAARRLLGDASITPNDLFALDDDDSPHQEAQNAP